MKRAYYLRIKFKEKFDGRKIWYINDGYICDCVNTPFIDKEKATAGLKNFIKKESIHIARERTLKVLPCIGLVDRRKRYEKRNHYLNFTGWIR